MSEMSRLNFDKDKQKRVLQYRTTKKI